MHLKGNMIWHTNTTFLPIPALASIIAAEIILLTGMRRN